MFRRRRRRRSKALAALACLALSPAALAISRVGNGRIESLASRFDAPVPAEFCAADSCLVDETESHGLVFQDARGARMAPSPLVPISEPLRLFADEFAQRFPDWVKLGRAELTGELASRGWKRTDSPDPCVEAWRNESASGFSWLGTWGDGRGVVLFGLNAGPTLDSASQLISGIRLEPGACAWH
jgi:hypothetical protein